MRKRRRIFTEENTPSIPVFAFDNGDYLIGGRDPAELPEFLALRKSPVARDQRGRRVGLVRFSH